MSFNESRGALQVFEATVPGINDALRQVRDELDGLFGLRGRVLVNNRVAISDPSERSDALVWGADAEFGRVRSADGSALLPANSYTLDTNLGSYRVGADNEGYSAGGVLRWDYDATRLKCSSGYRLDAGGNQIIGAITDKLNATHLALASQAIGDLLYADATSTFTRLGAVAVNSYLRSTGVGAAPAWSTLKLPNAATVGDVPYASATDTLTMLADVAIGAYLRSGGVATVPLWSTLLLPNAAAVGDVPYGDITNRLAMLAAAADGNVFRSAGLITAPLWGKVRLSGSPTDITGTLAPGGGGTGLSSYAIGDLLSADGATSLARLADVAVNQVLMSGGVGVIPAYSATPTVTSLNLSGLSAASVVFVGTAGLLSEDNVGLTWNNSTKVLKVKNATATAFGQHQMNNAADDQLFLRIYGSTAAGTTAGIANANMAQLGADPPNALLIRTVQAQPIVFAPQDTEIFRMNITGGGVLQIGAFGAAAVAKQTSGANLTNNVTAGGTTDQIDDFTSLTTYATDAAAIRNDIYQLARKVKQLNDGLRSYGWMT